jgi:hypothetical protein
MSVAKALPTANADGTATATPTRTGTYGEAYTLPLGAKQSFLADEGSYYLINTTTPGTGVAGHAAPVAADLSTKPLVLIYNGGLKHITIDFIKVRMTAIGAGASTTDFDSWYDQSGATRYSSGAIAVTPVNCLSSAYGSASSATAYFGAVVTGAAVQAKRVGHSRVRSVVAVVEDQYLFTFGPANHGHNAAMALSGTAIVSAVVPMAPVVIAPGGNFLFVQWGVSQSGAHSADMEVGFWER